MLVPRATLDTNVCGGVADPRSYAGQTDHAEIVDIRQAILDGRIAGYVSAGSLALEALKATDRIDVLFRNFANPSSRRPISAPSQVEQRFATLFSIGCKVLVAATRLGLPSSYISVPANVRALDVQYTWHERLERHEAFVDRFQDESLRSLRYLGEELADAHRLPQSNHRWVEGLVAEFDQPLVVKEQEKLVEQVRDLTAEWCDLDILGSHYACGIDYFCTRDRGISAGPCSVLHASRRALLEQQFGIQVVSPQDLVRLL